MKLNDLHKKTVMEAVGPPRVDFPEPGTEPLEPEAEAPPEEVENFDGDMPGPEAELGAEPEPEAVSPEEVAGTEDLGTQPAEGTVNPALLRTTSDVITNAVEQLTGMAKSFEDAAGAQGGDLGNKVAEMAGIIRDTIQVINATIMSSRESEGAEPMGAEPMGAEVEVEPELGAGL